MRMKDPERPGKIIPVIPTMPQKKTKNKLTIIGVGGIYDHKTMIDKFNAGASLVQIYTGWIFEGPNLVPNILDGLTLQIEKHGFKNIKEAIGSEAPWE